MFGVTARRAADQDRVQPGVAEECLQVTMRPRTEPIGELLGRAQVNIADMALGRGPTGEHALMVLSTDSPVPPEVVEELRAQPGILDAKAIELD